MLDDGLTTNETLYAHYQFDFLYTTRALSTNYGNLTLSTLHTNEDLPDTIKNLLMGDFHIYNNILSNRPNANVVTKDGVSTQVTCNNDGNGIMTVKASEAAKNVADIEYIEIP